MNYKVPLRHGSSSLKPPRARAAEKLETAPEALRGGTQVLGGGHMRAAQTPAHLSPCGTGQQVVTDSRVTWAPGRQVHCPGPRTAVLQKHHVLAPHPPGTGHPVSSRAISSTWMQERGWKHTEAHPAQSFPSRGQGHVPDTTSSQRYSEDPMRTQVTVLSQRWPSPGSTGVNFPAGKRNREWDPSGDWHQGSNVPGGQVPTAPPCCLHVCNIHAEY